MNSLDDTSNYTLPTKKLEKAIKLVNGVIFACNKLS
ncbi:hypothetical protein B6N60_02386 [Richelia sinica FACHB-800]|uniref:Uncharacterized protein n=1 Tax=Richelia sinica FACHB-800 TaxID=1357546 RepID=A0A975T988_9NOST|nr:hypothetical protein B6N60_02386 [Richelia sinica FACHB-800]